jgi:hypothetical protein
MEKLIFQHASRDYEQNLNTLVYRGPETTILPECLRHESFIIIIVSYNGKIATYLDKEDMRIKCPILRIPFEEKSKRTLLRKIEDEYERVMGQSLPMTGTRRLISDSDDSIVYRVDTTEKLERIEDETKDIRAVFTLKELLEMPYWPNYDHLRLPLFNAKAIKINDQVNN